MPIITILILFVYDPTLQAFILSTPLPATPPKNTGNLESKAGIWATPGLLSPATPVAMDLSMAIRPCSPVVSSSAVA